MTNEPTTPDATPETPAQSTDASQPDSITPETPAENSATDNAVDPGETPAEVTPAENSDPVQSVAEEIPASAEAVAPTETGEKAADVPAVEAESAIPAEPAPAANAAPTADETPAVEESVSSEAATEAGASASEEAEVAEADGADAAVSAKAPRRKKLSEEEARPVWEELVAAHAGGELISCKLARSIPGGALVEYKGLEGFVPKSQFSITGRADQSSIDTLVGEDLTLVVIEISDFEKQKFVCSRKKALKKEKIMELKKNTVMEGTVTSITSYGAFVDLGGVDGLIHISRLSKIRVNTPSEVVKVGDSIKVRIVDINLKNERIALSHKEFTESPWSFVDERYTSGSICKGKIRNITDFGVYVQLEPGIVGMVHISDLSWTKRLQHPSEVVNLGDEIEVKILDVKPKDKRIALSLKETQPNPWPRLANVYPVDTEANGTIKQLMESGAIVSLDFDVDCFVPRGKMSNRRRGKGPQQQPGYNVGDVVRVKVVEMDPEGNSFICAVVREEQPDRPPREPRQHGSDNRIPRQAATSDSGSAFTLGEIDGLKNLLQATASIVNEAPVAEAPVAEAPVAEAPVAEAPVAEAPVAEAPVAEAPVAEAPVAEAPVAEAPVAEAPVEEAPAEEAPAEEDSIEPASDEGDEETKTTE